MFQVKAIEVQMAVSFSEMEDSVPIGDGGPPRSRVFRERMKLQPVYRDCETLDIITQSMCQLGPPDMEKVTVERAPTYSRNDHPPKTQTLKRCSLERKKESIWPRT
jgi:hypothetical protein